MELRTNSCESIQQSVRHLGKVNHENFSRSAEGRYAPSELGTTAKGKGE